MEKIQEFSLQIVVSMVIVISFLLIKWGIRRSVSSYAKRQNQGLTRLSYVLKMFNMALTLIALFFLVGVWEISIEGLSVYFASIFTIVGVAFFASWSVLSNITAALILFFYYPFTIGSKIKILDGDNSIVGEIKDITLFTTLIESEEKRNVVIPNNIIMQKTTVILS